jgi:hypothetical protein
MRGFNRSKGSGKGKSELIQQSDIVKGKMLGEGEFGEVIQGEWLTRGKRIPVAIKTLRASASFCTIITVFPLSPFFRQWITALFHSACVRRRWHLRLLVGTFGTFARRWHLRVARTPCPL